MMDNQNALHDAGVLVEGQVLNLRLKPECFEAMELDEKNTRIWDGAQWVPLEKHLTPVP